MHRCKCSVGDAVVFAKVVEAAEEADGVVGRV